MHLQKINDKKFLVPENAEELLRLNVNANVANSNITFGT